MKNSINRTLYAILVVSVFFFTACRPATDHSKEAPQNIEQAVQQTDTKSLESITKHTVVIEKMQFNPAELMVHKGDTIVWINKGIVEHDITEVPEQSWTSGKLKVGDSWETTTTEGFDYICSIHMTMKGSVKIVD